VLSQNLSSWKKIDNHPMLTYLQEGRKIDSGWLQKEETEAINKLIDK
jgi:hypothetical protein